MAQSPGTRIFMTGASGYIGSVVTEFVISQGYEVHGLSRTEDNDTKMRRLGAVPVRGNLQSLDVLRRESENAQIVIHLAGVMTRHRDYNESLRIDAAAVDAICQTLRGTGKRLLVTSGSMVPLRKTPVKDKVMAEEHALSWSKKEGVHVVSIRLAPYVYGRGGSGVRLFMQMYRSRGSTRTSAVHLLAAEKAKAGEVFNCTSSTDAIGSILDLPIKSVPFEEAVTRFGMFLASFLSTENWASSTKAIKALEWGPSEPDILEDITAGSYATVTKKLLEF
ncbi:putative NAD dependent epimerase/dehydratase [Talaromyces proteolyticus]|uniref:NAD dependent epimerase/dehydratase n=1 Tax=Talaromyces proteolyticus TaxID=1131652 RepID=A0AAD4L437_9EURO|nr:putative NAD dependent epimerase/dehydratase [Talaromyces proteolyticus]KAH8703197.1 putative NAD dependent epimerase/dehydratase [Talaromyces proteolyticus]